MRSFPKNLDKFIDAGIRVVGISVDTPEKTRDYMLQKAGYTFTFLSDPKLEAIGRYDLVHAKELASGKDIARHRSLAHGDREFFCDSAAGTGSRSRKGAAVKAVLTCVAS
ncbi:MAG: hypothetical protein DME33_00065 [Verrucomicrobia bacterium]|nr:MAG: hypothetical protein DME33_00065 [Verrucomicrobiota bacterium]